MSFVPEKDSILPPTSTPLEIALESIGHVRLREVLIASDLVGATYDIDRMPASLLDYMAWQWDVDVWDEGWTDDQKRQALKGWPYVQSHRGTVKSVKDAVRPWGGSVSITEWFEDIPQGNPYTFKVNISSGSTAIDSITAAIDAVKPLRAHYTVSVGSAFTQGIQVGALLRTASLTSLSATL